MSVAPLGVSRYSAVPIEALDREGAELAAITHGHSLGYMPAAVLTHILHRIVYPERAQTLLQIVCEARDTVRVLFAGDKHLDELTAHRPCHPACGQRRAGSRQHPPPRRRLGRGGDAHRCHLLRPAAHGRLFRQHHRRRQPLRRQRLDRCRHGKHPRRTARL